MNNYLLDTPEYHGAPLDINTDPRNGRPAFNNTTAAFTTETLGQLGNVPRRFFYGPGISNLNMTLTKVLKVTESTSFEFRLEAFNLFNHAQFYGAAAVDREVSDPHFVQVVSAAAPRLSNSARSLLSENAEGFEQSRSTSEAVGMQRISALFCDPGDSVSRTS